MDTMLVYSFVARGNSVLADYTSYTGATNTSIGVRVLHLRLKIVSAIDSLILPQATLPLSLFSAWTSFPMTRCAQICPYAGQRQCCISVTCIEFLESWRSSFHLWEMNLQGNNKVAFNCDQHTFNYLIDGGYSKPHEASVLEKNAVLTCETVQSPVPSKPYHYILFTPRWLTASLQTATSLEGPSRQL